MGKQYCGFPNKGTDWCIICRERENFVPNRTKLNQKSKKILNRKLKELKACTGLTHVPHSGAIELKCRPRKLKTCEYPDERGWWCKKCVDRSGIKPQGNVEKEKIAQERKKRKHPTEDQTTVGGNEPQKKKRKDANGQPAVAGATNLDKKISAKKRPRNVQTKKGKDPFPDTTPVEGTIPDNNGKENTCPKGLKSCKFPSNKGWWCRNCNGIQNQNLENIPEEQDKTSLGSHKNVEKTLDLNKVGGANSRHKYPGESSQGESETHSDSTP